MLKDWFEENANQQKTNLLKFGLAAALKLAPTHHHGLLLPIENEENFAVGDG